MFSYINQHVCIYCLHTPPPHIVVPPMAAQEQEVVFHLVFQWVAFKINVTRYAAQISSHQTVIIVAVLHLFAHKAVGCEHAVYTASLREPKVLGYDLIGQEISDHYLMNHLLDSLHMFLPYIAPFWLLCNEM